MTRRPRSSSWLPRPCAELAASSSARMASVSATSSAAETTSQVKVAKNNSKQYCCFMVVLLSVFCSLKCCSFVVRVLLAALQVSRRLCKKGKTRAKDILGTIQKDIRVTRESRRLCKQKRKEKSLAGEMWKSKAPFRLVLNKAASDEIIWHCKHLWFCSRCFFNVCLSLILVFFCFG
ncbi:unnamed protein product [Polarella glacialis]|uniref:Uncharacterized protein n=1 Tax=Polarella glacialis TaxID=89957 RepID=A0A813E9Y5_POLGL|nr:unnamed protein product [Polarella glacialis]